MSSQKAATVKQKAMSHELTFQTILPNARMCLFKLAPCFLSDAPLELPSFKLTPSQRQVVFQGDSLPFQCQASFVAEDMQVLWYQNGRIVKPDAAQGIFIEKRMVQNCSLIARYGDVATLTSKANPECFFF